MRIVSIRALPGPNVFLDRPILKARLNLEALTEKESFEAPGFVQRLLQLLPDLHEHHCAKGAPGGFIERLHSGTYFGHIVEHVALELNHQAGIEVNFGRTIYADAPGLYDMVVEYKNEPAGRYLLQAARELVDALVQGESYPLEAKLSEARRIVAETELGPSTQAIVDAAQKRSIPWLRLNDASLVQLGYGIHRRFIQSAETSLTSSIAVSIACDKALTKKLLDQAAIPVPRGLIARSREEAIESLQDLRPPVAVKPLDGNQGKGVSLCLSTADEIAVAYDLAAEISRDVVVEEYFLGCDYRVLVVDGNVVAASERTPAHVVADGEHTIEQLIEIENQNPLRGAGHGKPLTRITADEAMSALLEKSGQSLQHVPAQGERVFLRETANLSTGGTARDVTDEVHPQIAQLCERAARIIGLDICGIDLILPDISQPMPRTGAGIVEVNATPGLRMHEHPSDGAPHRVGEAIIDMLYPSPSSGRIPIVSVTGTNGKTTVTRMIHHILTEAGKVTGMTTTDGIHIGGQCVAEGDLTGSHSARTVLSDPSIEVAVLETARGGIVRRGLGYDWSDVGVLTNIQADHLGQDGIETVDDLFFIKSLVAERIREGGTLVLNADDERLARLPQTPRVRKTAKHVVFFSLSNENPVVEKHIADGGTAYLLQDGWLIEAAGSVTRRIVRESALPITLGGAARFQTANVLAALAASAALEISREQAAAALMGFQSDQHNKGRMNLYRVGHGYVVVDYGHNLGAFEALSDLANAWSGRRLTGIFTVPGDRRDELIEQAGRQAARCFDRLIIREDTDLRGRKPGEVAELLRRTVHDEAPEKECIVVQGESKALQVALEEMEEGEVILLFYEKHHTASLDVLRQYGAVPAKTMEPVRELQRA